MRLPRFRFDPVGGMLLFGFILIAGFGIFALSVDSGGDRDYILDNVGRRWEVRHIGGNEYIYNAGKLVMLRPCSCRGAKRDSL